MPSVPLHQQAIEIRGIDNCEEFDKIIYGGANRIPYAAKLKPSRAHSINNDALLLSLFHGIE